MPAWAVGPSAAVVVLRVEALRLGIDLGALAGVADEYASEVEALEMSGEQRAMLLITNNPRWSVGSVCESCRAG